jgi:hypothetical protein
MFKVLILQTSHSLSDERTKYPIKDRLSFMVWPTRLIAGFFRRASSVKHQLSGLGSKPVP